MTPPTRADAIDAMRVVKEWCLSDTPCRNCPIFHDGKKTCMIGKPYEWEIPNE